VKDSKPPRVHSVVLTVLFLIAMLYGQTFIRSLGFALMQITDRTGDYLTP